MASDSVNLMPGESSMGRNARLFSAETGLPSGRLPVHSCLRVNESERAFQSERCEQTRLANSCRGEEQIQDVRLSSNLGGEAWKRRSTFLSLPSKISHGGYAWAF